MHYRDIDDNCLLVLPAQNILDEAESIVYLERLLKAHRERLAMLKLRASYPTNVKYVLITLDNDDEAASADEYMIDITGYNDWNESVSPYPSSTVASDAITIIDLLGLFEYMREGVGYVKRVKTGVYRLSLAEYNYIPEAYISREGDNNENIELRLSKKPTA